jgi:hypothetical protein
MGVLQVRWPVNHGVAYSLGELDTVGADVATGHTEEFSKEERSHFRLSELVFVNVVGSMIATGTYFTPLYRLPFSQLFVGFMVQCFSTRFSARV